MSVEVWTEILPCIMYVMMFLIIGVFLLAAYIATESGAFWIAIGAIIFLSVCILASLPALKILEALGWL